MKKIILIAIPLLVLVVIGATLFILSLNRPPEWRVELSSYQTYENVVSSQRPELVASVRASQPWNFTPEMSQVTFSDGNIFITTFAPDQTTPDGVQPLPFPPEQLWCVQLREGAQSQMVFVALHSDIYYTDWVVHIPAGVWGSSQLQATMDSLGCKLEVK